MCATECDESQMTRTGKPRRATDDLDSYARVNFPTNRLPDKWSRGLAAQSRPLGAHLCIAPMWANVEARPTALISYPSPKCPSLSTAGPARLRSFALPAWAMSLGACSLPGGERTRTSRGACRIAACVFPRRPVHPSCYSYTTIVSPRSIHHPPVPGPVLRAPHPTCRRPRLAAAKPHARGTSEGRETAQPKEAGSSVEEASVVVAGPHHSLRGCVPRQAPCASPIKSTRSSGKQFGGSTSVSNIVTVV